MTGIEFKQRCRSAGLSYKELSPVIGKSEPMIKLYATDRRRIPGEVEEKMLALKDCPRPRQPRKPSKEVDRLKLIIEKQNELINLLLK